jgi:hypothetical protein
MTGDHRTPIAFALALGMHAALWFAFTTTRSPHLLQRSGRWLLERTLEIDLEAPRAAPAVASPTTGERDVTASLGVRARVTHAPPVAEPAPGAPEAPPVEAPTSREEPRRLSLAELGIGAPVPLVGAHTPEKLPDPAARAARSVEKSINDALAAKDREIGLGSDGPVVSALERATYGSALSGNGTATFVARIDSSGRVSLLQVLNVNGDHKGWSKVARRALATLSRRKLRVPQGAKGVELRIKVESRWALPSGADPGLEVRMFGVPLKKGQGKRSSRISIFEPVAKVEKVLVPQPGGGSIEMPVPQMGVGVLGVAGDPSDIGAKPRRIVHAEVESQKLL